MDTHDFDLSRMRAAFPALKRLYNGMQVVYFDGPGGSQVAQPVIAAVSQYMERGGANLHGVHPTSIETEAVIVQARASMAALLNCQPEEVAFGPNMTTLNFSISRALSRTWDANSEIVVTEMDHRANVDPWLLAARDAGARVKWLSVDTETLTLRADVVATTITPNTEVVAIGLASNAIGTIQDVARIALRAKEVGALVVVDAVHAVPHISVDTEALHADILLCSAYKFFGPHVGIAVVRESVFEQLNVYKLDPAPASIPDKLETGTQNHEGLAGVAAAVGFIAEFGKGTTLREKLVSAMRAIEHYEDELAAHMRRELRSMPHVTLYAAGDEVRKTPTIALTVSGRTPQSVCEQLVNHHSIFAADGDFYASTLADRLGLHETGGWVRIGLAPYNTRDEADALLEALRRMG